MDLSGLAALMTAVVAVPLGLLPILNSIRSDRSKWRQLERLAAVGEKLPNGSAGKSELLAYQLDLLRDLRADYNMTAEDRELRRDAAALIVSLSLLGVIFAIFLATPIPMWLLRVLLTIAGGSVGVFISSLISALAVRRRRTKAASQERTMRPASSSGTDHEA